MSCIRRLVIRVGTEVFRNADHMRAQRQLVEHKQQQSNLAFTFQHLAQLMVAFTISPEQLW